MRDEARRAAELLRDSLQERWTLDGLAQTVHLSPSQLGRVFVEAYGTSPIAYLAMLRIQQMAHLLHTTDQSVAVIAHQVGWRDPDFASRQFRRRVGTPPSEYRRRAARREASGLPSLRPHRAPMNPVLTRQSVHPRPLRAGCSPQPEH
ncbi:hypothetical protein GCM10025768_13090 [Microbacterium pseudoresistens]|uniref:helix-turn-helix domain-containing protein n=1 Tax=Microbacterium pseudoresistens TaxID=640634 RepID=UPI0015C8DA87